MKCNLCPRHCGVNREKGELGYCKAPSELVIAKYSLHPWEEPLISGSNGSGTIFFSYCNLGCCFCQNYEISTLHKGKIVSVEEFSDICLNLQKHGATNINLVTPTPHVLKIIEGLKLAKSKGLNIPIVYNTSSYELPETINLLSGLVDIYLADLKFYDNYYGKKYAKCPNYFTYASKSINTMYNQVGEIVIENNILKKGLIVRHLLMPNALNDSKKIVNYLYQTYHHKIIISLMNQYTPVRQTYEELNQTVSESDYEKLIDYAYNLGIRRAFVQEGITSLTSFIPDFNKFCDF